MEMAPLLEQIDQMWLDSKKLGQVLRGKLAQKLEKDFKEVPEGYFKTIKRELDKLMKMYYPQISEQSNGQDNNSITTLARKRTDTSTESSQLKGLSNPSNSRITPENPSEARTNNTNQERNSRRNSRSSSIH